jgi:hypothetical protein
VTQDADDSAGYCTPSYVKMEAGMSWVRLGRPEAAAEIFERSLAAWPAGGQTRDRGLCLARLATASAAQGHLEQCGQTAVEAVTIARSTGSSLIRMQLRLLYNELAPHSANSSVRNLQTQLRSVA